MEDPALARMRAIDAEVETRSPDSVIGLNGPPSDDPSYATRG
jgi:hypothetical protein